MTARAPGAMRLALLALTVAGCLAVFALARLMAHQPHVALTWGLAADGHSLVAATPVDSLLPALGAHVLAVRDPDGRAVPWPADAAAGSLRWVTGDAAQADAIAAWTAAHRALHAGQVRFDLEDGRQVAAQAHPRGYTQLGVAFWLLTGYALVLWLVGGLVMLLRPQGRNVLYLTMTTAQATQLSLAAVATVPALAPPMLPGGFNGTLYVLFDLITCSALLHAAAVHPARLPHHRWLAGAGWAATVLWLLCVQAGWLPHAWWWAQGLALAQGTLALLLLSWSLRIEPHPFAFVMRRIGVLLWCAMVLMLVSSVARHGAEGDPLPLMQASVLIWSVFTASIVLLVPFLAHSRRVMREVPIVAGTVALAVLANLLCVAVLGVAPLPAMVAALLLALATYAGISKWLLHRASDARAGATERMFEHLYRVARDVENRPERARLRMAELLEHVFEPLEARPAQARGKRSHLTGNGAMLLVPMPALLAGVEDGAMLALRGADRGRRLFSPDDARLADRIVEQLMRAVAQDRAVARGRSEERARIAQDLHDDIGARLLTLMYKAPNAEMENYVRHTLQDLKTLTRGLAAQSQPLSLAAAEWKRDMSDRAALAGCTLSWTSRFDAEVTLTAAEWSSLTRIVRELVSNVIAHAKASAAHIDCQLERGTLRLSCADNGHGKSPEQWSRGLGLGGIRKRVRLLGGEVSWREQAPQGIVCDVLVPRLSGWAPPSVSET